MTAAKNTTITARVAEIKRGRSSHFGNPRFTLTLDNGATLRTAVDAGVAYGIENPEIVGRSQDLRAGALAPLVTFTLDGRGNIIGATPAE